MQAVVTLMVVLALRGDLPSFADHNGPVLPRVPTAVQWRIADRGYGTYKLDPDAAVYPRFRQQVWDFYTQECNYAGLCMYEVGQNQPSDVVIDLKFGNWQHGNGVAGVAWYLSDPVLIEINGNLLYADYGTTISHEDGHGTGGQHEAYYDANGQLLCKVLAIWTRMSCGTGVKIVTQYDRDIIWNIYVPDIPSHAGSYVQEGWLWMYWNSIRKASLGCTYPQWPTSVCGGHPNQYLDMINKVSVWTSDDYGRTWQFTGVYGPPARLGGYSGRGFWLADWCPWPGRRFAIHPENNMRISWPVQAGGVGFLSGDFYDVGACPYPAVPQEDVG